MTEYPLLVFPRPQKIQKDNQQRKIPNDIHTPDVGRQRERLHPIFEQLREEFHCGVQIRQSSDDVDPEYVLVWEYIGTIYNFSNTVKRIPGFEWMGEIELKNITPDDDFYHKKNPKKNIGGRLYLTMTNKEAIEQLLSLWHQYQRNPKQSFQKGLNNFKKLFEALKTVRRWDVQDRLEETGLLTSWQEDLIDDPQNEFFCEIELWFRSAETLRSDKEQQVGALIRELDGEILQTSVIEEISYHALLAKLPAWAAQHIISDRSIKLVTCNDIMFIRPAGQAVTKISDLTTTNYFSRSDKPLPSGTPTVALLDGMPIENHGLLANRLFIDDPDNWKEDYPASARLHGTSMASLIIHGDLNQQDAPISRKLYVRPIMQSSCDFNGKYHENVPSSCLFVDLIHRAVHRIFEGEGEQQAVAPQVQIINFSIGIENRQFTYFMSPLARLIDWLSYKYNVLFIVSAGNHTTPISLPLSTQELEQINPENLEKKILKKIIEDRRNRRLLSPAETINGITVGALHYDSQNTQNIIGHTIKNPFVHPLPSPFSSFGFGYRNSIKPDMTYAGGRQLYRIPPNTGQSVILNILESFTRSGIRTAAPAANNTSLNDTIVSCGTSYATALISREAFFALENLDQIFSEQIHVLPRNTKISLLKALLIHGCSWEQHENDEYGGKFLEKLLNQIGYSKQSHHLVKKWMGYGQLFSDRIMACTPQRATILGYGELNHKNTHIFKVPIPPSLNAKRVLRRLTVTLAWISPIAPKTQKYRSARLWFEIEKNNGLVKKRVEACGGSHSYLQVRNGTVQHEIFIGDQAGAFKDELTIQVNCSEDAAKLSSDIGYGLVVSLEVSPSIDLLIYNEIKERIAQPVGIQTTINT